MLKYKHHEKLAFVVFPAWREANVRNPLRNLFPTYFCRQIFYNFFYDCNQRWTVNSRIHTHSVCYRDTFLQGSEENCMEKGNCFPWRVFHHFKLGFNLFFSWKQKISALLWKGETLHLVLWECMMDPWSRAWWQKIKKN